MIARRASSRAKSSCAPRARARGASAGRSGPRAERLSVPRRGRRARIPKTSPLAVAGEPVSMSASGHPRVRQSCERGRRCREAGWLAIRTAQGGRGDQQPECPDRAAVSVAAAGRGQHALLHLAPIRPICRRSRSDGILPAAARQWLQSRPATRERSGGPSPSPGRDGLRDRVGPRARLRRQFRLLQEHGNGHIRQPTCHEITARDSRSDSRDHRYHARHQGSADKHQRGRHPGSGSS